MVYAAQGDLLTAQCNVPIYSDPTNVGDINLSVGMIKRNVTAIEVAHAALKEML